MPFAICTFSTTLLSSFCSHCNTTTGGSQLSCAKEHRLTGDVHGTPPPLQNYYVGPPFGIEQNGEFIQQPHHANRSGWCGAHPICIQPTGGLRGMSYLALDGHHPREGSTHAGLAGLVWPGHELGFRISMYVAILNEKICDDLALLPHVFQFVDPLEGWETIVALRITIVPLISPRLKNSIP